MNVLKEMFTAAVFQEKIDECKETCKASIDDLSDDEYEVIQGILRNAPDLAKTAKKGAEKVLGYAQHMDVETATALMENATDILRSESTVNIVDDVLRKYGPILKSEKNLKAIGAYLKCVLKNLEPRYQAAVVAMVEMFISLYALISNDNEVRTFLRSTGKSFGKYVVDPVQRQINATANTNTNTSNARSVVPNSSNGAARTGNVSRSNNAKNARTGSNSVRATPNSANVFPGSSSMPKPAPSALGGSGKSGSGSSRKSGSRNAAAPFFSSSSSRKATGTTSSPSSASRGSKRSSSRSATASSRQQQATRNKK